MTSIGHRTGLFDAMAEMPPATSAQIAASCRTERALRARVAGRHADGGRGRARPRGRHLQPAPRARRAADPGGAPANIALQAQYIPLLGAVEDEIVACFRKGGGVPYTRYGRFHELMAEDSGQSVLPMLREHILPLVPGLIERLERGIRVLDVGCGRGRAVNLMAEPVPEQPLRRLRPVGRGGRLSPTPRRRARATRTRASRPAI